MYLSTAKQNNLKLSNEKSDAKIQNFILWYQSS